MDESKQIQLVSQSTFNDQDTFDTSDRVWLIPEDARDSDQELVPTTWLEACRRLRDSPLDHKPQEPFFNVTGFDFSAGGCAEGETWAMCDDMAQFGTTLTNSSCYVGVEVNPLTEALPNHYAYPIYGIIFPVLLFFAIVANVFVMIVLSKRHMQSPTNIVLLYMSIADLTVGIVPLPFTFYWFTLRNFTTPWRLTPHWCYAYHYLMDALPPICHNVAIWSTVLLAAQRYVYIEFPVRAQDMCTIQKVRRTSFVIVTISIICGAMRFGDQSYKTYRGFVSTYAGDKRMVDYAVGVCLGRTASFVKWYGGEQIYYDTYFWIRAVIFVWLPSLLLICLNVLLIRAIHRAQQRRDRLLSERRNREATRQKESNNTTTMLVIIVSIFLLVNCPQGLHIALITVDDKLNLDLPFLRHDSDGRALSLMIDNMLIIATYPLNFAIYCSMSTQFRDTFKHLFCPNSTPNSNSGQNRTSSYYGYKSIGSGGSRNGDANDLQNNSVRNNDARKEPPKDVTVTLADGLESTERVSDTSL